MSLSSALTIATNSLGVSQEGITTSSNNLANINTPGYIRQADMQDSVVVNGVGQGAQIVGLSAVVDATLLKSINNQTTALGSSTTTDSYYTTIQNLYGQPNSDNSISSQVDAFFSAYQTLGNNPETPSLRTAALNASIDLANKISTTASNLQDLRFTADKDIGSAVLTVNTYIANLVDYNAEIIKFQDNTSGYINVKQKMTQTLGKLSEFINVATTFDSKGKVSLSTGSGISLIDDATNARLQYSQASSVDTFTNNIALSALKIVQLNEDGSYSATSTDLATSGVSSSVVTSLSDGSIKSLLTMRDSIIPKLLDQLDTFSAVLTNETNAVQNNGSGFPPPSSLTGTTLVTNSDEVDFTGSVRISVLKSDGTAPLSPYPDESNLRPLTIDLGALDSGLGTGRFTAQTIIDQINNYYGPVQNRAVVGNLRNVQLEAVSSSIATAGTAQFDLKLDNTSENSSTVVIQSITVIDPNTNISYSVGTLPSTNSYTLSAGDMHSTGQSFSIDLTTVPASANYTIRVGTQVTDSLGNVSSADVDFNVTNNVTGIKNTQYNATAVTNTAGTSQFIVAPGATTYASASLVDSNGNPAVAGQTGVIKITTSAGRNLSIVIDELDSKEVGVPGASSADITNRGFSHYFGLNNLFVDNGETGGSALNMAVRSDIETNANLLSTGQIVLSKQPSDGTALYTYELGSGNNAASMAMSELSSKNVYFAAAGSLPSVSLTFSGYSGDVIGAVASDALNASNQKASKELGMDGLQTLFQKSAGVNSDQELSHIIELQNHFSASAQVINIIQKLFDILNQSIS